MASRPKGIGRGEEEMREGKGMREGGMREGGRDE